MHILFTLGNGKYARTGTLYADSDQYNQRQQTILCLGMDLLTSYDSIETQNILHS